ncbi:GRAM domain-containing protein 2A isoform X4 [Cavia porcellus]|uniref:GRAM domain-containing protein 2A isoform X4 n=1 Tax=Cavia porcellus TaxID=10141 RepID=UPI002FE3ED9A
MVTLLWPFRKACFSARKEPQRAPPRLHPRGGVAWPGSCLAPTMSNRQMNRKTAALKSPVSYTEKPDRAQESPDCNLHWPEDLKGSEKKKDGREGTLLNKYNHQYHKLFKDIPLEEMVLKACSCALQRDLLIQGRLYISPNWLCFHASLFGKDIKGVSTWRPSACRGWGAKGPCPASQVVIPVVSVQMVKKHKMARLLPNGLAITTNTSQKYVFVSLLSRDSVYDVLRRVCTHLQPSSKKSLSVRKFPEDPECKSLEVLIPKMKWRKICPAPRSLLISDSIPCVPQESLDSTDGLLPSGKPAGPEDAACETWEHEEEPAGEWELQLWDSRLLKVIFTLAVGSNSAPPSPPCFYNQHINIEDNYFHFGEKHVCTLLFLHWPKICLSSIPWKE